jgi:hypothetical protein
LPVRVPWARNARASSVESRSAMRENRQIFLSDLAIACRSGFGYGPETV